MTLASGARLGPYEILELIGRGGMGEVYRALDTRLTRQVAIKVLPSHLATDEESLKRFRREARAIAALSHPNILAVFDIGSERDTQYVVTELLDGHTLRTRMREQQKLSIDETLRIAGAIADGLAAAHAKGVVHRDIKPENIFLTSSGAVKILDFGLAAGAQGGVPLLGDGLTMSEALTQPGMLIGTVGYMSPEQLRGGALTPASDVFSLGCVIFEMLAGEMPFERDNPIEIIAAVVRDEPFARGDVELPIEIRNLIEHALTKDPKDRYHDGAQLAAALRTIAAAHATGHLSTATMRRVRLPLRKRIVVATVVAILVIAAAIGAYVMQQRRVVDAGYDLRMGDISGSNDVRRLTALAMHADAAGDRTEAIELLREAARMDAKAPLPAALIASFTNVRGDEAEAARWNAETKKRLANSSSSYETLLCRYLLRDTDTTTEMAISSSILDLRPKAWRLRLSLAHLHLYRRELAAALAQLQQIDISAPDDRRLAIVLSDRAALGDPDGAERDVNRSNLTPPLRAYTAARIASSRGRWAEAVRDYDAAADIATARNLIPVANESRLLGGAARIATGDIDGAQTALDLAAVKAQQTGFVPEAFDAYGYGAYDAYRRGDRDEVARHVRAAFAITPHNSVSFHELRLFAYRMHLNAAVPRIAAGEKLDEDVGVPSLIAAREAWSRGDLESAKRLLQQARSEGVDSTWFAEEAALLAHDLQWRIGASPVRFRCDPPYPNRLRFIAIWELARPPV